MRAVMQPVDESFAPEFPDFDLDTFFEISPDLLAVAGTDGYFKRVNHAWQSVVGWEPEILTSNLFTSFVHPDDLKATMAAIHLQKQGGNVIQFENRYRCKDGEYRWLEWSSTPIEGGLIFAVARDKTEQKRLQLERDRFFEISMDLLVIANIDGTFRQVNDRWCEVFGWQKHELVSRKFIDLVHPDDIAATIEQVERQKIGEPVIKFENRFKCADGTYRWLEWKSKPEPDGTIYGVARDITDQRNTEQDLIQARQDAEEANLAKSKFLAAMSHDLRTPLNAIMGFSDMMRQKAFGELGDVHYVEYADDIYKSGSLLVSLINDILDLSKIEAGKYQLNDTSLEIREVLAVSAHQLTGMAERNGVKLVTDVNEPRLKMRGDERVLIQIFNNILSNAVKFTSAGGCVTAKASLQDCGGILITVSDTGIGMSDAEIKQALVPFQQLDGTYSRQHDGTGLGLTLCVNLMKLFGGTLDLESEVGVGTEVALRFPPSRTQSF